MKRRIYLLGFAMLSIIMHAQTYTYQWAKTGGAINGSGGTGFEQREDEHILDMVVDQQNNTYYLTAIYNDTPLLDGQPVTNYSSKDHLLFSTDCQGNVRWTRTIGGHASGQSIRKLTLDNAGGLYMTAFVPNNATFGSGNLPPRFGDNDIMPVPDNDIFQPQAALKTGHLLKYNTVDGNLAWRREFQGNVPATRSFMDMSEVLIDSQNHLHVIVGLQNGTHLNDLVTVQGAYNNNNYQYFLVKYNLSGTMVGTPALLPLTGITTFLGGYLQFMYDEANNRYYLGGSRGYESGNQALSYNNVPIVETGFLLAFNSTTFAELWRREFDNGTNMEGIGFIYGLKKDPTSSNIYLSGKIGQVNDPVTFGNYPFVTPLTGSISYIMKLSTSNTGSNVLWCTYPTALSDGSTSIAIQNARMPIAFNGNEILFAKGSIEEVWGAFPMVRPTNDRTDPLLVRLNKNTGVVTGTHEIQGSYGQEDHFTAVATDMDGNIMLGGFINAQLFIAANDNIPTISNVASSAKTNFFITKLATSSTCTQLATAEIPVKETDVVFYPNPVEDILFIKTKETLQTYEIVDASGRLIKQGKFEGRTPSIQMQGLVKGIYYVKVGNEEFTTVGKVVKK